jgi:predicted lipid-binding transport protein (Tim44 family)
MSRTAIFGAVAGPGQSVLAGLGGSATITRLAPAEPVATCEQAPSGQGPRAHTGDMGRIIGTILGAILAIWLAFMAAGGIFATLKTFLIIGLIAMAVVIVVWLVARRPPRG